MYFKFFKFKHDFPIISSHLLFIFIILRPNLRSDPLRFLSLCPNHHDLVQGYLSIPNHNLDPLSVVRIPNHDLDPLSIVCYNHDLDSLNPNHDLDSINPNHKDSCTILLISVEDVCLGLSIRFFCVVHSAYL